MSGVYALDSVHTFVSFKVQHLIVGHVVGRFDETHGTITLTDDQQTTAHRCCSCSSGITRNRDGADAVATG